jgi:ribosomal protein S18 acetylase RimI-like enzyme
VSRLHVRQYEPPDADAVWDLHERALRDIGAFDEEYAHLDADLRRIPEAYLDAGGAFLVGQLDREDAPSEPTPEIVAIGGLQPATAVDHHEQGPETGVVRRMRVDPDRQRQGYGSTILAELETRGADLGFSRLVLDTTPRQTAAMSLYESFGCEETRRESTPAGEMVFYEKLLSE